MQFPFIPSYVARSVVELSPALLHELGIKLLMLDFDNTIVPYTTNEPTQPVLTWLEEMMSSEIQICVVSNSRKTRVRDFCRNHNIECVTHAKKPFSKGIRQCLARYEFMPRECALVGDQIYTDILGANCAGVRSILVKAIHNHNFWLKARHVLEMPWIWLCGKGRTITKK